MLQQQLSPFAIMRTVEVNNFIDGMQGYGIKEAVYSNPSLEDNRPMLLGCYSATWIKGQKLFVINEIMASMQKKDDTWITNT